VTLASHVRQFDRAVAYRIGDHVMMGGANWIVGFAREGVAPRALFRRFM
jgi:hypothetical protein